MPVAHAEVGIKFHCLLLHRWRMYVQTRLAGMVSWTCFIGWVPDLKKHNLNSNPNLCNNQIRMENHSDAIGMAQVIVTVYNMVSIVIRKTLD